MLKNRLFLFTAPLLGFVAFLALRSPKTEAAVYYPPVTSAGVTNAVTAAINAITNVYEFALGDETTAITTGTKVTWRAPFALTIKDVRASLTTASSSGLPTFNILESGVTIFSTKVTINANATTSVGATTPYVLSDTAIANDASVTFTIDVAGTSAAGPKVKIYYTRP
jgi:hypothetical protein